MLGNRSANASFSIVKWLIFAVLMASTLASSASSVNSGLSGFSGLSSFSGFSGPSSFSGFSGPSSFSGFSGSSSFSGFSGSSSFSSASRSSGRPNYPRRPLNEPEEKIVNQVWLVSTPIGVLDLRHYEILLFIKNSQMIYQYTYNQEFGFQRNPTTLDYYQVYTTYKVQDKYKLSSEIDESDIKAKIELMIKDRAQDYSLIYYNCTHFSHMAFLLIKFYDWMLKNFKILSSKHLLPLLKELLNNDQLLKIVL